MLTLLKKHEEQIIHLLSQNNANTNWKQVYKIHRGKVKDFQHERLVHLLIMLFVIFFMILFFAFSLSFALIPLYFVFVILFFLSFAYILYYYKLENAVQKMYELTGIIEEKLRDGRDLNPQPLP